MSEPVPDAAVVSTSYIHRDLIEAIRNSPNVNWNTDKLVQLAEELQDNWAAANPLSAHMCLRAILDHIPPLFGHGTFAAVASNYSWSDTDRAYMRRLRDFRAPADDALHRHIARRGSYINLNDLPPPAYVNALLAECLERLRLP